MDSPILIADASPLKVLKEKHLPTLNLLWRLHDIWGIDVVRLKKVDDLYKAFTGAPSISATNLLDLYGVKYVISVTPIEGDPNFELVYSEIEGLQGKKDELLRGNTIKLYRNHNPLPRAWLVKDHRALDQKSTLAILSGKEFTPRKEVLLEEEPLSTNPKSQIRNPKSLDELPEFVSEGNNRLLIHVKAPENAFLVLSDTYFPGWKAYVDGKEEKIYQANYNFRAVLLPPGDHRVEFIYRPMSFIAGAAVTVLGIIGCAAMLLFQRSKQVPLQGPVSSRGDLI